MVDKLLTWFAWAVVGTVSAVLAALGLGIIGAMVYRGIQMFVVDPLYTSIFCGVVLAIMGLLWLIIWSCERVGIIK